MDAVKGLFQIHEINVYLNVPLDILLNDISEGENVHPTPALKPACSFLKMVLMASLSLIWMILQKILLGTERSATPCQFVHCVLSSFLGSLMISPLYQSSGMVSASQIL